MVFKVIRIDASDNLTKFICHDCELTINHFSEFCEMVKKAQEKLSLKYPPRLFGDLEVIIYELLICLCDNVQSALKFLNSTLFEG